ncbi:hypothetical protein MHB77_32570 [Paenibacillus sp. FSL K6-3166]|uniref:BC1872 family protein n=1 Tax=unclassified Paenibacillus TaxID=185978 RepID=UPI000B9FA3E4|nr:hypothetical protein [Paenibacillus sp. VTT E-133291]OZQ84668.1 hypothetical protein CA598_23015 [Paenibacillus sp. VTT E-133291]
MNRDEIIAKWAGLSARERDAWVAEVVFGLNVEHENGETYVSDFGIGRVMDEYTTDISAAWAVWSAMLVKGYEPLINTTSERSGSVKVGAVPVGWHHVCLHKNDVNTHAELPTAPEALCLAALIAKLTEDIADGR